MSQDPDLHRNPDYYGARSAEERRLAMAAKDPKARAIHEELANEYARLARQAVAFEQTVDDRQRAV